MSLSYTWRFLCLVLIGIGMAQVLAEFVFWSSLPRFILLFEGNARRQERILFVGQIATHVAALLFAIAFLLPHYLATESNRFSERIGILSIAIAVYVVWRYLHALFGGIRMYARSMRLRDAIVTSARIQYPGSPAPLANSKSSYPPLAVIGLAKPCIVIAESLLGPAGLSTEALAVALDHERAHLRQRDNWKLLALNCLPRLGIKTRTRPASLYMWQRYSDWAADDDAARGSRSRALTLAESLISCAKLIPAKKPEYLFTGLATHEEELQSRIDRLLLVSQHARNSVSMVRSFALAAFLILIGFAFLLALEPWLSAAAEAVLHLG
jgi:beta-lactamase regulating signal transducer with metallopeptidase domain